MHISIETSEGLTAVDKAVLRALLGESGGAENKAASVSTPAKKATPPAAVKTEPTPEPEVTMKEAVEPEVDPEPETEPEVTMKEAVDLATKLVSEGKAADVKAALAKIGVKRVSELKDNDEGLATFVAALS